MTTPTLDDVLAAADAYTAAARAAAEAAWVVYVDVLAAADADTAAAEAYTACTDTHDAVAAAEAATYTAYTAIAAAHAAVAAALAERTEP